MRFSGVLSVVCAVLVAGCTVTPREELAFKGGAVGAGVGAGTGAIIGAAISNGDIGASALLGAGIGLPIGALGAIYYASMMEQRELDHNQSIIRANQERILAEQDELNALRERLEQESHGIELDPGRFEYIYNGPTIGVYQ